MSPEHAVIINFYYDFESMDKLVELENKLRTIIHEKGVGEYDGHDIALIIRMEPYICTDQMQKNYS